MKEGKNDSGKEEVKALKMQNYLPQEIYYFLTHI